MAQEHKERRPLAPEVTETNVVAAPVLQHDVRELVRALEGARALTFLGEAEHERNPTDPMNVPEHHG